MATPKSGLRFPAALAAPNVPQDIQNLATDLDSLAGSYATAAARDAANPTPATNDLARVAGILQIYSGGGWVSVGVSASHAAVTANGTLSLSNQTWSALNFSAAEGTQVGPDLSTSVSGIVVSTTGWYACSANFSWAINATGIRGISIGSAVSGNYQKLENAISTYGMPVSYAQDMLFNAGDTITLGAWQNTGGILTTIGYRHLTARRIG